MHKFVPGRTLLEIFESAERGSYRFPEAAIWQFGATMLEIVSHMLYSNRDGTGRPKPMNHNDIYPRNVLVTNPSNTNTTSQFHLIDFGLATRGDKCGSNTIDLQCICNIMYSMMLGKYMDQARQSVLQRQHCRGWPYSSGLAHQIDLVHDIAAQPPSITMPPQCSFDSAIAHFQKMARLRSYFDKQGGGSIRIHMRTSEVEAQAMSFKGDRAELDFYGALRGQGGCYPCQRALYDVDSHKVLEIERTIIWSRPEDEPMLESMEYR